MKKLLISIVVSFSSFMFSQDDDISGSFSQSIGQPEGGTTLIVLPNNQFVATYFGGLQKGTWEKKKNNMYEFTYHAEPKFVLYGRYNPQIKDSVSVNIATDNHNGLSVRINGSKNSDFIPIFNNDSNCFDYPYYYKQKEQLKILEAFAPDYQNFEKGRSGDLPGFYSFNIKMNYNDFILTGLSEEYTQGGMFEAKYEKGVLYLDEDTGLKKSSEYNDLQEETLNFIEEHTATEILPKILEYGNEFFPYYDNPTADDLIPFQRLASEIKSSIDIKFSKRSLFVASCDK